MKADRQALLDSLANLLRHSNNTSQWVGLLLVDIRDFSNLNRLYGYAAGDAILRYVEQQIVMVSENANCYRLGNDEFAIILPTIGDAVNLELAANQLSLQLNQPVNWLEHTLPVAVNIGACAAQTGEFNEDLMFAAEHALGQAKKLRRDIYINDIEIQKNIAADLSLRKDFEQALHENMLEMFYQPKILLNNASGIYSEALLRWQHPNRGFIPPDDFLPICEQLGLNIELTKWVINAVLRQISQWPGNDTAHVAINVTADIIDNPELLQIIQHGLSIWGVDPSQVTIEITESAVIGDMESGCQNLAKLREMGLRISIDDFGTGYSSLEYFKHIPADELKIDRTFVQHLVDDTSDQKLIKLMIELGHSFGLKVVAEGIEDEASLSYLANAGCDFGQGYFIAKPMPYNDFVEWNHNYQLSGLIQTTVKK
jgi:diguanylate cyclase (GGDEF)-like protein